MKASMFRSLGRPVLVLVIALAALPFVDNSAAAVSMGGCGGFCDWQCASPAERAAECALAGGTCGIGSTCHFEWGGQCGIGNYWVSCQGNAE